MESGPTNGSMKPTDLTKAITKCQIFFIISLVEFPNQLFTGTIKKTKLLKICCISKFFIRPWKQFPNKNGLPVIIHYFNWKKFLLFWFFFTSATKIFENIWHMKTLKLKNNSHFGDWTHENYRSYQSKHKVSKFLFMVFLCKILDQ